MKLPPWSYSFLTCYQRCPALCFRRYIAKDMPYVETPQQKWGNEADAAMAARISAGKPLSGDCAKFEPIAKMFDGKAVETKLKLGVREDGNPCGFFDTDCWGRTELDLLYTPGDFTLRIFDWKTGKVREDPFELRINALFAQARNPEVRRIVGHYVWLGQGAAGKLGAPHELGDVERTWAEVSSMMNTIKNFAAVNHWPQKDNYLCKDYGCCKAA